jgi:hypothetical protein
MEKQKLAVTQTVMDSVSFGWANKFTTLRLIWVGFLIYLVAYLGGIFLALGPEFFTDDSVYGGLVEGNPDDVAEYFAMQAGATGIAVLAALALVPFYVVMYRYAAGEIEAPSGFGYFQFGGRELRFVIGYFVAALAFLVVAAITLAPFGISLALAINNAEGGGSPGAWGGLTGLFLIIGVVLLVWFSLRMTTFMPAVAVENRLVLFRALRMTGGNVWRILGGFLLMMLLMMAIVLGFYLAIIIVAVIVALIGSAIASALPEIVAIILAIPVAFVVVAGILVFYSFMIGVQMSFVAKIYAQLKGNSD